MSSAPDRPVLPAVADVLGRDGAYRDPVWQLTVQLTPVERELMTCWWVRRLHFVAHAGAAAIGTTQTYSRLEHSLGLLALTAHFTPDDRTARVAALLHDVGHLPLSHTFEGVAGLDHHDLGKRRIADLADTLHRHGLDPDSVVATETGKRRSALSGAPGSLKLDHFESLLRSGQAHGRTAETPSATLARVRVRDGCVTTDAETAEYLAGLVAGEARWLCSETNAITNGATRYLAGLILRDADSHRRDEVAAMTDTEFWALLLTHPRTAAHARSLRSDPWSWSIVEPGDQPTTGPTYEVKQLYLDMPRVDGSPLAATHPAFEHLPDMPWRCDLRPPPDIGGHR
ncbi:HD domain-containing protein [Saccharopolyspora halophila]|uniref:HD domain-containing protein n=1 Tax=Saccharopolyspora halophila TaxID=405551 RepID=UPI0031DCA762